MNVGMFRYLRHEISEYALELMATHALVEHQRVADRGRRRGAQRARGDGNADQDRDEGRNQFPNAGDQPRRVGLRDRG